jgi:hypothetical protein
VYKRQGSGYVPGTYTNVQLNYSSGSTVATYPKATVVVGSGGTVSSTIVTSVGSGIQDYTTVLTASASSLGGVGSGLLLGITSAQTGGGNTAIGYTTLFSNINGSFNIALGAYSLYSNTTAAYNVALGAYSLYSNTSGYQNTALGHGSGRYMASGTGLTNSNNSIFLGYDTRSNSSGETNQIVIGYSAIGNGSNSVTLGNTSITKTILRSNVGIGLTGPSTKLHIYATQSGAFRLEDGTQGSGYVLTSDSNGVGSWTASTRYKSYVATITQTGTSDPVATVLENTFNDTFTWTRNTAGNYQVQLTTGTFSKLYCTTPSESVKYAAFSFRYKIIIKFDSSDITNKSLVLSTMNNSGSLVDDLLYDQPVEIRVYY